MVNTIFFFIILNIFHFFQGFPGFNFGDGGFHLSFGIGAFPFGFLTSFNFSDRPHGGKKITIILLLVLNLFNFISSSWWAITTRWSLLIETFLMDCSYIYSLVIVGVIYLHSMSFFFCNYHYYSSIVMNYCKMKHFTAACFYQFLSTAILFSTNSCIAIHFSQNSCSG